MQEPRPCIFINAHKKKWEGNDDYYMWKFGDVVDEIDDFKKIVNKSISNNDHEKIQKKLRDELVTTSNITSSDLCAEFIAKKITPIK